MEVTEAMVVMVEIGQKQVSVVETLLAAVMSVHEQAEAALVLVAEVVLVVLF